VSQPGAITTGRGKGGGSALFVQEKKGETGRGVWTGKVAGKGVIHAKREMRTPPYQRGRA